MNENIRSHYFENDDKMHEECGVFGMYDFDNNDVATSIYYGLFALQHRGQESCGIAVSDTEGPKGKVSSMKGMGLVNEVYTPESFEKLKEFSEKNNLEELKKIKLVLAGEKGWSSKSAYRRMGNSRWKKDIILLGGIQEEDKEYLYNLASVFVYPSFFEGFGFPPLEAMACGVPVIASNNSSVAEIVFSRSDRHIMMR